MRSCSEDHRRLLRLAFGTGLSREPTFTFDAGYSMTTTLPRGAASVSPRRTASGETAKRSPVSPKATAFAHEASPNKRRRSETAEVGSSGSGSHTVGGSPQIAKAGRRATLADLGTQHLERPTLDARTSFERGGAGGEQDESSPAPNDGDVDMDANADGERSRAGSPRAQDDRLHRPSLPGIKHLFTLAGNASDSSRPDAPGFPTLSALQGPLMSRSSVSSDVSAATSGRLSRLSSFADERQSFSTSASSGVPSAATQPSPGVAGWWGSQRPGEREREKDDAHDVTPDEATDFARKRSYAAFAASLEAKAQQAGGRAERDADGGLQDLEPRRWSDMPSNRQHESHARANRTHSYPVATAGHSREHAPRDLPSPSFKRPGNSPLKWSTIREGQPLLSPISPTHGPMSIEQGRRPSVLQDPASGAPSFVSPFAGSGVPSTGLQHPQPQPVAVRTLSGVSETTERENVQRWREGMDPAEPYPHLPVQRSRSGPSPASSDGERRSSSSHRVHPYDRDRPAGRHSADYPAPVMGPYDQQMRKGSIQHGPELHRIGSPFRWGSYDGPTSRPGDRPIHSADAAGRWYSFAPPRGERSGHDDRRQSQIDPKARLSPRPDGQQSSMRGIEDQTGPTSTGDDRHDAGRRRSDDPAGRHGSPYHRPGGLDSRGVSDSWQSRPAKDDNMPSVLRPAPAPGSMPGHPQRTVSDYAAYDAKSVGDRSGQYQPIRVYPATGMPTAELPRPISSNENGPQGPGEHGTIVNGPNGPRYICNFCGKTFTRPSSLRIHTYSHTGERPYVCNWPNCGRSFSVQSNLKRHAKTHTMVGGAPGDAHMHAREGQPMDLSRRHSYDVVPLQRGYSGTASPAYGRGVSPERVPSDGPGRMSLGSLMDGHTATGRQTAGRQRVKVEDRPEINLDEEEEDEEDELADELDDERLSVST